MLRKATNQNLALLNPFSENAVPQQPFVLGAVILGCPNEHKCAFSFYR